MRIVSPYTNPQLWLKGNFHTHTNSSDGLDTAEAVVAMYRDDNYDFLAITDHREFHDGKAQDAGKMLVIAGQECHIGRDTEAFEYHVVSLGAKRHVEDQDSGQAIIDEIRRAGGLPIVAHPRWSYMPYEVFDELEGYAAFEVYNGGCSDVDRANSSDYWDWSLTRRARPMWGVGCDDMHKPAHDFASGWTWVNAEKDEASILSAIERGDFYASGGPRIENIRVDESGITLYTTSARFVKFLSREGTVVKWAEGKHVKSARYEPVGGETYVRAEVHAHDGTIAWTNPFFIEAEDESTGG